MVPRLVVRCPVGCADRPGPRAGGVRADPVGGAGVRRCCHRSLLEPAAHLSRRPGGRCRGLAVDQVRGQRALTPRLAIELPVPGAVRDPARPAPSPAGRQWRGGGVAAAAHAFAAAAGGAWWSRPRRGCGPAGAVDRRGPPARLHQCRHLRAGVPVAAVAGPYVEPGVTRPRRLRCRRCCRLRPLHPCWPALAPRPVGGWPGRRPRRRRCRHSRHPDVGAVPRHRHVRLRDPARAADLPAELHVRRQRIARRAPPPCQRCRPGVRPRLLLRRPHRGRARQRGGGVDPPQSPGPAAPGPGRLAHRVGHPRRRHQGHPRDRLLHLGVPGGVGRCAVRRAHRIDRRHTVRVVLVDLLAGHSRRGRERAHRPGVRGRHLHRGRARLHHQPHHHRPVPGDVRDVGHRQRHHVHAGQPLCRLAAGSVDPQRRPGRSQPGARPHDHPGGRRVTAVVAPPTTDGLSVRGLSVRFGGLVAVDNLDLDAPEGRLTGLIGPNGAGKTTTFDACSGLNTPSEGSVHLFGNDVSRLGPPARAQRGLGRTFQRMELFNSLSVADNVALGREAAMAGSNVLRQIVASRHEQDEMMEAAAGAMELCGISDLADRRASALSTGQRRLVELARALAGRFRILLLDEPSSGLDHNETARFGDILERVMAERGVGLLLVEHDMSLVMRVCHHVYVLDFGKLIFEGSTDDIRDSEIVRAAYLGAEEV
ncbi:MAG: ABC transporter ATP-binding protein [Acidobacteria bacterium]|nr:ABC transporter ATP-binding protein [Acidobacteriota bacterium]